MIYYNRKHFLIKTLKNPHSLECLVDLYVENCSSLVVGKRKSKIKSEIKQALNQTWKHYFIKKDDLYSLSKKGKLLEGIIDKIEELDQIQTIHEDLFHQFANGSDEFFAICVLDLSTWLKKGKKYKINYYSYYTSVGVYETSMMFPKIYFRPIFEREEKLSRITGQPCKIVQDWMILVQKIMILSENIRNYFEVNKMSRTILHKYNFYTI